MNTSSNFVPPGVNADSWMGFEGRVRERRFQALLENASRSLAAGDAAAAAVALEEARELQPDADELLGFQQQVDALVHYSAVVSRRWTRLAWAGALMLAGVALAANFDYFQYRDQGPDTASASSSVAPAVTTPANTSPPTPEVIAPTASDAAEPDLVADGDAVPTSGVPPDPRPIPPLSQQPDFEPPSSTAPPPPRAAATSAELPGTTKPIPPLSQRPDYEPPRIAATPSPAEARPDDLSATLRPAAVTPTAAPPAAPPVTPTAAPTPAAAASEVVRRDAALERAPVAAPVASSAPAPSPGREEGRVAAALDAYAHAFARLDARAARFVWPSVDERALARAFDGLASQNVVFDDCSIDVQGTSAHAACRGTASYVAKVGRDNMRVEPRTWRFELRREGESWKIASAEARRP